MVSPSKRAMGEQTWFWIFTFIKRFLLIQFSKPERPILNCGVPPILLCFQYLEWIVSKLELNSSVWYFSRHCLDSIRREWKTQAGNAGRREAVSLPGSISSLSFKLSDILGWSISSLRWPNKRFRFVVLVFCIWIGKSTEFQVTSSNPSNLS